jgi:hypothetical protein
MSDILNSVNSFAGEMLLFQAAHDKDFIKKILQFDVANELDVINSKELTKFIVGLGQYTITLTSQYNAARVHYNILNREFTKQLKVASTDFEGKSKEERESRALLEMEELKIAELEVEESRAKMDLLENMSHAITELINGFKSELNRRYKEWEIVNKER